MSNSLLHPSDAIVPEGYNPLANDPSVPEITDEGSLRVTPKDCFANGTYADIIKGYYLFAGSDQTQEVAVKVLRFSGMTQDASDDYSQNLIRIDKRLAREMLTWKRLKHPRITPLLGYARSGNNIVENERPILVSPYRKNSNLRVYLVKNPNADRLSLIQDVCDGLTFLHNFDPKVVHLDLKPDNILIDDNGGAEICDFGLSRTLEDARTGFTTSGNLAMTVAYAAPEVLSVDNMKALGQLTEPDIYSLGCVMVEVLSGVPPWGIKRNATNIIVKVTQGKRPPRAEHNIPGYSVADVEALWNLMDRCWAKEPSARPTAEAVKAVLIEIQQRSTLPAESSS